MIVSQLDELFEIVEYQVDKSGQATVDLVDGTVRIRIPYRFRSTAGVESPAVMVNGEATPQQLTDLKMLLGAILQATNSAIESQHGWTKYTEELE